MSYKVRTLTLPNYARVFVFLFCSIWLPALALASSDIHIDRSSTPSWVAPVTLPAMDNLPTEQIQKGIHYALLDTQIRVDKKAEPIYFVRLANHIVNTSGVEQSSQINISYDPTYQQLRLHSLQILREGQVIDKFATARMTHLQREEEMDELIYSGRQTLNIILDDVRVGDTLEYSYSIVGMNPVYQGLFAYHAYLGWSVPVGRVSERILWNKTSPLHYRIKNSNAEVVHTNTATGSEYRIQIDNPQPQRIDEDTPDGFDPWGSVQFSELASWGDVARWSEPLYQNVVTRDAAIDDLITDIKSNNDSLEQKISAALRFAQDEIRYLGIELGENSHKPTSAPETLRQRYGDCKDKTVLLLTLLRALGVEAYPALVNTKQNLADTLPNSQAFDHVITLMIHQGKRYWLDPTRSFQHGDIDRVHQPDYGHALVLNSATQDLTAMQPDHDHYGVFVTDRFVIPEQGPVQFSTETINHGWNAERQRYQLASKGLNELQQDYLGFLQGYYPGAKVQSPMEYSDDDSSNVFSTTEHYLIDNFWQDKPDQNRKEADFFANIASSWIAIPDQLTRSHPLSIVQPNRVEQTIEVHFASGEWNFDNEQSREDNEFFRFDYSVDYDQEQRLLTLKFSYRSKASEVPPERYPEYRQALERADPYTGYGIYTSTIESTATENSDSFFTTTTILLTYFGLFLLVIILWRIDRRRNPDTDDAIFFPVAPLKFIVLWVLTFGLYGVYWFYRNFRYIKEKANNASMPLARGIFYAFWYYPLWDALREDSAQRYQQSHLPGKPLALLLALVFLFAGFASGADALVVPGMFVCALLVLPLVNYIAFANGDDSAAMAKNSRWLPRHLLLIVLSLPLCVLSVGSEIGLLPNDAVIKGSRLLSHDLQFMQRKGIIKAHDTIEYFYSDALFFIREDGNGFTERHVFSYWKEGESPMQQEVAEYKDIEKIDVNWGSNISENSTVTITRKDGSEFLLFVSTVDRQDSVFVKKLKDNWQHNRN